MTLLVVRSVLTLVQDLGRPQTRQYGVPPGGAMDRFALVAANRLVGNPPAAAALEITAGGATFELTRPAVLALTGARLGATLDGLQLPAWTVVAARGGAQIDLPGRAAEGGGRAYLAFAGGIDVPVVLGSRSTYLPGSFGGLAGRALRAGDRLELLPPRGDPRWLVGRRWPPAAYPTYSARPLLRVLAGPHLDCFAPAAGARFVAGSYRVSANSNRMGYRLQGPQLAFARPCSLPSLGVFPGVVQVPPDGTPILLMADAQTTGGYPIVAVVIGADLPLAAQLLAGDEVGFVWTTPHEAVGAWNRYQYQLEVALDFDPDDAGLLLDWAGAVDHSFNLLQ